MGLISRVSSRTYRNLKKWPSILTESYQTRISESERHGPNSPRPGLTSQPKRSPDDPLEPPRPRLSPHDQSPVPSDPLSNAQPSDTTPRPELDEVSLSKNSRTPVWALLKPNKSASALTADDETSPLKISAET